MTARRLTTWKEIGAYIGRDGRTAKRYELERGLPVHRLPGAARSVVYAFSEDLDRWLQGQRAQASSADVEGRDAPGGSPLRPVEDQATASSTQIGTPDTTPSGAGPSPSSTRRVATAASVALAVAALLALIVGLGARRGSSAADAGRPDALAMAAYRDGDFAWRQRTPQSLRRAVDDFTQAIVRDPGFAQAYTGLAISYNLMTEYGGMTPADAYPRAEAAVKRALELTPDSAQARQAYAFTLFWWERNAAEAWRQFQIAIKLDPASADAHHWYANTLAEVRDPRAIGEIEAARAIDPASTSITIDLGWADLMLGRLDEAARTFAGVKAVAPNSASLHRDLAELDRLERNYPAMLKEMARDADLRQDAGALSVAQAGQAGLQAAGRLGMWRAIVAREEALEGEGGSDATSLAADELELGRKAEAIRLVAEGLQQRDSEIPGLMRSPEFASLRNDPAFRQLVRRAQQPG